MQELSDEQKSELCMKCYWCCKVLYLPVDMNIMAPHWGEFAGRNLFIRPHFASNTWWAILPLPCPNLTDKGCRIYKQRPDVCRNYDGRKDIFYPGKCLWNHPEKLVTEIT